MGLGRKKSWGTLKSSYGEWASCKGREPFFMGEKLTNLDTIFCIGELHTKLPDPNKWLNESRKITRTSKDELGSKTVYLEVIGLETGIRGVLRTS